MRARACSPLTNHPFKSVVVMMVSLVMVYVPLIPTAYIGFAPHEIITFGETINGNTAVESE